MQAWIFVAAITHAQIAGVTPLRAQTRVSTDDGLFSMPLLAADEQVVQLNCTVCTKSNVPTGYLSKACIAGSTDVSPATLVRGSSSSWSITFDATGLSGRYEVCFLLPGRTVDMAFKVFVSPVLEMVSSPNCRAVFCDFRVRCALGGASCGTIVLHSTICPDDTSNPNVIGEDWQTFPADRSRTYPLQPLGNGLIQAVDHTGGGVGLMGAFLRRGYHFKVCVDLDNDDDIHAMEWTGLTIYAPGPNFALTRSSGGRQDS
jgi:hypothetical protein